ncbi:F-box only protein 22 [Amphibalanus amphitrite]|uniref:F-box only protein 22 n=1 Tax=Amphibalanus amphitrite TaxID=1232801 RepID=A0A6A4VRS1_AMPAM|nr:F-box only protein 22 [Amphibalanus amphitrite]
MSNVFLHFSSCIMSAEPPVIEPCPDGLTTQQTALLTSEYEVLRLVLSHLPCSRLHAARAVCRAWRDVADIILKKRRTASWQPPLWDTETVPVGDPPAEAASRLVRRLLDRCYSEPAVALFAQSLKGSAGRRRQVPRIEPLLPPGCAAAGVSSLSGCVATPAGGAPLEEQAGDRLGVLLIPRRPGAQVGLCLVRCRSPATVEQVRPQLEDGAWDRLRGALVFFSSRRGMHTASALARLIHSEFGGTVALAGGWVDLLSPRAPADAALLVYFSGPGVRAASAVVDEREGGTRPSLDTAGAAQMLAEMRYAAADTIGFMSACCGRGGYAFVPGFEAAEFARVVPDVPLLGVFVNGELGAMTVGGKKHRFPTDPDDPMIMSYTTLFMVVNFCGEDAREDDKSRGEKDRNDRAVTRN